MQEQATELEGLRQESRQNKENQILQQDTENEWQSKLHDQKQEMNVQAERYETQLRELQAEIEERDMNLEKSKATMKQLDERFLDCTRALEAMEKKKQQYKHQFSKSSKQAQRLE